MPPPTAAAPFVSWRDTVTVSQDAAEGRTGVLTNPPIPQDANLRLQMLL